MLSYTFRRSAAPWVFVLTMAGLLTTLGCKRDYYRRQADREVTCLVESSSTLTRDPLDDFTIQPHRPSRLYDAHDPDHPPMPPDDCAAHNFMHCVDGKYGYPFWDRNGCISTVENPYWRTFLPVNEEGVIELDRIGAVQLALLHSPEYQQALENLYLSALDVTFQRFRFDAQYFGGNSTFYTADGRLRGGRTTLNNTTDLQLRRLTAPGGELVVGLANQLVWQFAGPDSYDPNTILDFTLVQPLLRGGGRRVVMENLTQSERALLANIRQLERFRRGFFIQIIAGGGGGGTPSTGSPNVPSSGGLGLSSAGGYLNLLETQVRIRNQEANVVSLEDGLNRLTELFRTGKLGNSLQVEQSRQQLLSSQSGLISARANYQTQLDNFKISLGLPPDLEVTIDDPLLNQFDLIDARMTEARAKVDTFLAPLRDVDQPIPEDWKAQFEEIRATIPELLALVEEDLGKLAEAYPKRVANLRLLSQHPALQDPTINPQAYSVETFQRRVDLVREKYSEPDPEDPPLKTRLLQSIQDLEMLVREEIPPSIQDEIDDLNKDDTPDEQDTTAPADEQPSTIAEGLVPPIEALDQEVDPFREAMKVALSNLSGELLLLSLLQARARLDSVTLVPVEITSEQAFRIAAANRRDWMNARTALVDSWRQIDIAANDLMSDLDVTFSGDLQTPGDRPFNFTSSAGRLRVGLEFDAPLTRLAERNAYRRSLINYQRTRRSYYRFQDRVDQVLRRTVRDIRLSQIDFEIQRAAVLVAIVKVDLAELNLSKPVPKGQNAVSSTAARDLIDALNELLRAQNDFLAVWVDYQAQRMSLDFDLGTMEIDEQGLWVDPGPIMGDQFEADIGLGPGAAGAEVLPLGEPIEPMPGEPEEEESPLMDTVPPLEDGENPQSADPIPVDQVATVPLLMPPTAPSAQRDGPAMATEPRRLDPTRTRTPSPAVRPILSRLGDAVDNASEASPDVGYADEVAEAPGKETWLR